MDALDEVYCAMGLDRKERSSDLAKKQQEDINQYLGTTNARIAATAIEIAKSTPLCSLHPDPELWFPSGESRGARKRTADAKEICGRCVVREQCLAYALDNSMSFGIWGGKTESERKAEKRRRGRR